MTAIEKEPIRSDCREAREQRVEQQTMASSSSGRKVALLTADGDKPYALGL